jgi:hypothetical protein
MGPGKEELCESYDEKEGKERTHTIERIVSVHKHETWEKIATEHSPFVKMATSSEYHF